MNNICFRSKFFTLFVVLRFIFLQHKRSLLKSSFIQINNFHQIFKISSFEVSSFDVTFVRFFSNLIQHQKQFQNFNRLDWIVSKLYRYLIFIFERRFICRCDFICQRCEFILFNFFWRKKIKKKIKIDRLRLFERIRLTKFKKFMSFRLTRFDLLKFEIKIFLNFFFKKNKVEFFFQCFENHFIRFVFRFKHRTIDEKNESYQT